MSHVAIFAVRNPSIHRHGPMSLYGGSCGIWMWLLGLTGVRRSGDRVSIPILRKFHNFQPPPNRCTCTCCQLTVNADTSHKLVRLDLWRGGLWSVDAY